MQVTGEVLASAHTRWRDNEVHGKLGLYFVACVLIAVFAFVFNWATGHRGVYLLDQSMIFDGGWRILQGQTPYKDFLIPFGPVTFYLQAFFFRVVNVSWTTMVLPTCLLNTLTTLNMIHLIKLMSGGMR